MSAAAIDLRDVCKEFGDFTALNSVSFEIADNEFFTLLGPSGCGKTTLLRMIAGFETPTSGTISVYGTQVAGLAPSQRPVNTVFQNYALFPHLDVTGNIGFGLRMLGWSKADIAARVAEVLALVKLEAFAARRPGQLSGGQQQRVALARAMAPKPKVLLLDEPLSALDLKLRQAMRSELKALQQETGITFVFVTHDQEEALTMSDRIAVMSAGDVQQIGRPSDIYEAPANRFVADFIGETNLLEVTVMALDGATAMCRLGDGSVVSARGQAEVGAVRTLSIRPERLQFAAQGVAGRLERRVYLGTDVLFEVRLDDGTLWRLRCQAGQAPDLDLGAPVHVAMDEGAARLLQG